MICVDVWQEVAHECPRRIIEELHQCGDYRHGTSSRFPGKVLCLCRTTPDPEGWVPTEAQEAAWEEAESAAEVA